MKLYMYLLCSKDYGQYSAKFIIFGFNMEGALVPKLTMIVDFRTLLGFALFIVVIFRVRYSIINSLISRIRREFLQISRD